MLAESCNALSPELDRLTRRYATADRAYIAAHNAFLRRRDWATLLVLHACIEQLAQTLDNIVLRGEAVAPPADMTMCHKAPAALPRP